MISSREEMRINETLSFIPQNCTSILDVGCGDGRITNRLISTYKNICGLDSSKEALKHVLGDKILGNLNSLPFTDKSFNLILCCEVLEHLPSQIYSLALKEIERVAENYIIITVPNTENRKHSSVTCPICRCAFNANRHVRSFSSIKLKSLFSQFKPQLIKPIILTRTYPNIVYQAYNILRPMLSNSFPSTASCPQCGYSLHTTNQKSLTIPSNTFSQRLLFQLKKVAPKKERKSWLVALYERI